MVAEDAVAAAIEEDDEEAEDVTKQDLHVSCGIAGLVDGKLMMVSTVTTVRQDTK